MKRLFLRFILVLALFSLTSCGEGQDPVSVMGDPTKSPTSTLLPIHQNYINTVTPYTDGVGGFILWSNAGVEVRTPSTGMISSIVNDTITIFHTSTMTTRIMGMRTITARVGEYYAVGKSLGDSSGKLTYSVYINGQNVCPYSYLDPDGRSLIAARIFNGAICLN